MVQEEDEKYFRQALELFYEAQWLYRDRVTEILIKNVLEQFPEGWLAHLEGLATKDLNEFVVNKITKSGAPASLVNFAEKCLRLDKLPRVLDSEGDKVPKSFKRGLSEKKQHEIMRIARLVHSQCEMEGIDTIVDLGCGLGYVSQLLNFSYGYRVLGLEAQESNVETAKRRQKEMYPSSLSHVKYICTRVDLESSDQIKNYLRKSFEENEINFCLIGLHPCADLGVDACKLFSKISSAKILILLSCCYHKLESSKDENQDQYFRNFPLSESLKRVVRTSENNFRDILREPFLRLACQEPAERWIDMDEESHRKHAFCVLARATLESFAREHSIELRKRVQKATRRSQCKNFETYLEDVFRRYEFCVAGGALMEPSLLQNDILCAWEKNSERLAAAEVYTGLQLMLQSLAESLVLNDRQCWLNEMGYKSEIVAVTRRGLSPRSHALVSKKRNE